MLKKWHIILSTVLIIFLLLANIVYATVWKTNIDIALVDHEKRIAKIERTHQSSRELLLEIKMNMMLLLENQGLEYIELTSK